MGNNRIGQGAATGAAGGATAGSVVGPWGTAIGGLAGAGLGALGGYYSGQAEENMAEDERRERARLEALERALQGRQVDQSQRQTNMAGLGMLADQRSAAQAQARQRGFGRNLLRAGGRY